MAYNEFFANLVRSPSGSSHVETEDDKFQSKMVDFMFTKILGKEAAKCIKVTGSAAQLLRCVLKSNKGDADIIVLSAFPKITQQQQRDAFMSCTPCEDLGFYAIKQLPEWSDFPATQPEGSEGVPMISAASLRILDNAWLSGDSRVQCDIVQIMQKERRLFRFVDESDQRVASTIVWRSSYSKEGVFQDIHVHFLFMLTRSYKENILPFIDQSIHGMVKEILTSVEHFLEVTCHYASSNAKMCVDVLEKLPDKGISYTLMDYIFQIAKATKNVSGIFDEEIAACIEPVCNYFEVVVSEEVKKLPTEFEYENAVEGFIDLVPAISCEGFPEDAIEWSERVSGKAWPTMGVVSAVLQAGFQIVPKVSKAEGSDTETSFRLSFNDAEELLALSITPFQRECFRVFKMYYYQQIQDKKNKVVETYHLKTVFFWRLEETEASYWVERNRATCCLDLLDSLRSALEKMHLRHYFIKGCNLFKYLPKEGVSKASEKVLMILNNPVAAGTGGIMEEIKKFYNDKISGSSSISGIYNTDKFLATAKGLFEKAIHNFIPPKSCQESFSKVKNDEKNFATLRFCYEMILARKLLSRHEHNFAKYTPGHFPSQMTIFIPMLLPVADKLIRKVFWPGCPDTKMITDLENYIKAASLFSPDQILLMLNRFTILKNFGK